MTWSYVDDVITVPSSAGAVAEKAALIAPLRNNVLIAVITTQMGDPSAPDPSI